MIIDDNVYVIKFGKHKGRRFVVVPMVKFEVVAYKVIRRAMKYGGQL